MNKEQLNYFKDKLTAWKQRLLAEAQQSIDSIQENSNNVADSSDRATLEEGFTIELKTRDRKRKLITKIDKALHEIETGEYGFCVTCGAEVGLNRLNARPTATECIECKTISERKED